MRGGNKSGRCEAGKKRGGGERNRAGRSQPEGGRANRNQERGRKTRKAKNMCQTFTFLWRKWPAGSGWIQSKERGRLYIPCIAKMSHLRDGGSTLACNTSPSVCPVEASQATVVESNVESSRGWRREISDPSPRHATHTHVCASDRKSTCAHATLADDKPKWLEPKTSYLISLPIL